MRAEPTPAGSVELRDYVLVLKRQLAVILAVTVLAAAAAAAWSFRRIPVYQATTTVLVRAITTNSFDPGQRVDQQLNMSNERQVVLSEAVAATAVKLLGTTATPEQLLEHVSADVPANSQVVRISYRDTVRASAQRGADAVAHAYLTFRENNARQQAKVTVTTLQKDVDRLQRDADRVQKVVENPDASATARQAAQTRAQALNARIQPLVTQIQSYLALNFSPGTVIAPAGLPGSPVSPKHKLDVGIGLLVGLLLAVGLAFLRDRTDVRLRGREDLAERLDRPVLAAVPRLSRWRREGRLRRRRRHRHNLVTLEEPESPAAEAYRSLRARLTGLSGQLEIRSVMVVSAGVGEGKSTTAANLAVVLAETGREVLLVSADLRRPRVHQFFGLTNREGLSDLLTRAGEAAVEPVAAAPNLWVLLSGPLPRHPSALLDSDAMRALLARSRDRFDLVVLDCPPALVVADALALAPLVDAVLVVGDARSSDREAIGRLREELEQVGATVVGAVLNRSKQAAQRSYYDEPRVPGRLPQAQ